MRGLAIYSQSVRTTTSTYDWHLKWGAVRWDCVLSLFPSNVRNKLNCEHPVGVQTGCFAWYKENTHAFGGQSILIRFEHEKRVIISFHLISALFVDMCQ